MIPPVTTSDESIEVPADPTDPDDFDVSEAGLTEALADRERRRRPVSEQEPPVI